LRFEVTLRGWQRRQRVDEPELDKSDWSWDQPQELHFKHERLELMGELLHLEPTSIGSRALP